MPYHHKCKFLEYYESRDEQCLGLHNAKVSPFAVKMHCTNVKRQHKNMIQPRMMYHNIFKWVYGLSQTYLQDIEVQSWETIQKRKYTWHTHILVPDCLLEYVYDGEHVKSTRDIDCIAARVQKLSGFPMHFYFCETYENDDPLVYLVVHNPSVDILPDVLIKCHHHMHLYYE